MVQNMKTISVGKLTLNIGAGKEQSNLDKAIKVIKDITGMDPVKTTATKRIAGWGIRIGLPIGCKLTLRKQQIPDALTRLLNAKDNVLSLKCFDNNGNISFGIQEYIDIPGTKYDPKIGIMGLQASITLVRPGFRVKLKKLNKAKIGKKHRITQEESVKFMKANYAVKIKEEVEAEEDND